MESPYIQVNTVTQSLWMTETFGIPLSEILEVQVEAGMKGVHMRYMHSEWVKEMAQYYAKNPVCMTVIPMKKCLRGRAYSL